MLIFILACLYLVGSFWTYGYSKAYCKLHSHLNEINTPILAAVFWPFLLFGIASYKLLTPVYNYGYQYFNNRQLKKRQRIELENKVRVEVKEFESEERKRELALIEEFSKLEKEEETQEAKKNQGKMYINDMARQLDRMIFSGKR